MVSIPKYCQLYPYTSRIHLCLKNTLDTLKKRHSIKINGRKKQNLPSPWGCVHPLIHVTFGRPYLPPQTTAQLVHALSQNYATFVTMGCSTFTPKTAFSPSTISTPSNTSIPRPTPQTASRSNQPFCHSR